MQFSIQADNHFLYIDNSLYHVAEIAWQYGFQLVSMYRLGYDSHKDVLFDSESKITNIPHSLAIITD